MIDVWCQAYLSGSRKLLDIWRGNWHLDTAITIVFFGNISYSRPWKMASDCQTLRDHLFLEYPLSGRHTYLPRSNIH
jgi:hypothetical protein